MFAKKEVGWSVMLLHNVIKNINLNLILTGNIMILFTSGSIIIVKGINHQYLLHLAANNC